MRSLAGSVFFFTLMAARLNRGSSTIELAGAGHPPAMLVSRDQKPRLLESRSAVLGLLADAVDGETTPLQKYEDESIRVRESSDEFYGSLALFSGIQSYQSEMQAENVQTQLKHDLAAANQKLENQTGQLTTIAEMLRVNSNDPVVLATALAQVLHPPEKLPCLNSVHFTAKQRQSPSGYETLIQISNPTGIKSGTTFLLFFNINVISIQSPGVRYGPASSGADTASITIAEDIPKGKFLTILAGGSLKPAQVKCVDRFDPKS